VSFCPYFLFVALRFSALLPATRSSSRRRLPHVRLALTFRRQGNEPAQEGDSPLSGLVLLSGVLSTRDMAIWHLFSSSLLLFLNFFFLWEYICRKQTEFCVRVYPQQLVEFGRLACLYSCLDGEGERTNGLRFSAASLSRFRCFVFLQGGRGWVLRPTFDVTRT